MNYHNLLLVFKNSHFFCINFHANYELRIDEELSLHFYELQSNDCSRHKVK